MTITDRRIEALDAEIADVTARRDRARFDRDVANGTVCDCGVRIDELTAQRKRLKDHADKMLGRLVVL